MSKKIIKKIKRTNDIVSSTLFSLLSFGVAKMFLGGFISEEMGVSLLSAIGVLYLMASKTVLKKADEVVSAKWYHFVDVVNSDSSDVATLISGIIAIPAFVATFNYGLSAKTLVFWCVFGSASMVVNYLLKTKFTSLESLLAKKLKMVADKIEVAFWAE